MLIPHINCAEIKFNNYLIHGRCRYEYIEQRKNTTAHVYIHICQAYNTWICNCIWNEYLLWNYLSMTQVDKLVMHVSQQDIKGRISRIIGRMHAYVFSDHKQQMAMTILSQYIKHSYRNIYLHTLSAMHLNLPPIGLPPIGLLTFHRSNTYQTLTDTPYMKLSFSQGILYGNDSWVYHTFGKNEMSTQLPNVIHESFNYIYRHIPSTLLHVGQRFCTFVSLYNLA